MLLHLCLETNLMLCVFDIIKNFDKKNEGQYNEISVFVQLSLH